MTEIHVVKHIDNSRLVKELDYQQTKECLLLIVLGVLSLLTLLFLAWQQFEVVRQGYEHEDLRMELNLLTETNHSYKVERAQLREPERIEVYARKHLGLKYPSYEQVVIFEMPVSTESHEVLLASGEKDEYDSSLTNFGAIQ